MEGKKYKIRTGSDFSGVGSFDQALIKLGLDQEKIFACDMDKYARKSYILNYGEPKYFPKNVYNREIPKEPIDLYMTSPPCQSFSFAGKRKGENDDRGILFYNSQEFIKKNNPRYFIFENVKGLISDAKGKTFQTWIDMLGGKSINGNPVIFKHTEAVDYHVYYKVLNAKHFGVPQNRDRVFIIGIRDDSDNNFNWPKPIRLTKKLKDVLEPKVDSKYYLSNKLITGFINHNAKNKSKGNGFGFELSCIEKAAKSITTRSGSRNTDNFIKEGFINQDTQASTVASVEGVSNNLCAGTHGYANGYVKIGRIIGRNPENTKSRISGKETIQILELNKKETSNALTTVQKDNVVVQLNKSTESNGSQPYKQNRIYDSNTISPVLDTECGRPGYKTDLNIRRLTPLECFRLMGFPDEFIKNTKGEISDTQLYKQAGNSIVVDVLSAIIEKLNL